MFLCQKNRGQGTTFYKIWTGILSFLISSDAGIYETCLPASKILISYPSFWLSLRIQMDLAYSFLLFIV
jgi:hypothetical protein